MNELQLGIIGCGSRAKTILRHMKRSIRPFRVAAVCDVRSREEILSDPRVREWELPLSEARFYTDADELLAAEKLDGVLVATRCSLHAAMACKVLKKGVPLLLEKPASINYEQLTALKTAWENSSVRDRVVVEFVLRYSPVLQKAKELLASGKIGRITHAECFNHVCYGGVYYHSWFRDEQLTGGLFLQKATHDLDYLNYLMDDRPVELCAMESRMYFHGDHPAGLTCPECPEKDTCPESPFHHDLYRRRNSPDVSCCFGEDTGNHDSASVLVRYAGGAHLVYTQDFIIRRQPLRESRFIGTEGTLLFDFWRGSVDITYHNRPWKEHHEVDPSGFPDSHYGGDPLCSANFLDVIAGEAKSVAPMEAALLSAYMCMKARDSAAEHRFMTLSPTFEP